MVTIELTEDQLYRIARAAGELTADIDNQCDLRQGAILLTSLVNVLIVPEHMAVQRS